MQLDRVFPGHTGPIHGLSSFHNEFKAISGSSDKTLKIWDLKNSKCLSTLIGHENIIWDVFLSSDNKTAFSISSDTTVKVWDLESEKCSITFMGHTAKVNSLAVGQNLIVTGSIDGTMKIWDLRIEKCFKTYNYYPCPVSAIIKDILNENTEPQVIYSRYSGSLNLLNLISGRYEVISDDPELKEHQYQDITYPIGSISIFDDKAMITKGKIIQVWDFKKKEYLFTLKDNEYTDKINQAIFLQHQGKNSAASVSKDGIIKVWDLESRKGKFQIENFDGSINNVVPLPKGGGIITASSNNQLRSYRFSNFDL